MMAKQLTSSPEARALLAESDTKDVVRYDANLNLVLEVGGERRLGREVYWE
jgi:hypothetical protein